ncbi:MAG: helix-turn-helix transcriptional regulator [Ruminococcaceae bacterium]|nr:helix-turn-helix transcriptional regulator [Oscillospiraceae bacterium]
MSEFDKRLGQKLRDVRISKGITQRSLAGEKITRNMLSLIENGSASPSLSTLMYLSEKLDTPAGYFFSQSAKDEGIYLKMMVIEKIRSAFSEKNYSKCEEIALTLPEEAFDDELSYILAVSYLNKSLEAAAEYNIVSAAEGLASAEVVSANSVYCSESFSRAIEYYSELFRSLTSDDIPALLCDIHNASEFVSHDLIEYFKTVKLLSQGEDVQALFPRGSYFDRHITAINLLMDDRSADALKRLRDLSDDPSLPYYMQYRVLSDLENAANLTGDVRIAYYASKRKLELTVKFKV